MDKFCGNCGAPLEEGARACGNCGTPIAGNNGTSYLFDKEKNNKKFGKKKIIILSAVAIAVIALTVSMVFIISGLPKKINLDKYVTVEFSGVDGYGKAYASLDWDQIQIDFGSKVKDTDQAKYYFLEYGRYTLSDAISEAVYIELSEYNKLSNGDVVELRWEQDVDRFLSAFNVKLSYNNTDYTVEGLSELTTFDAFSSVNVEFNGISPNGTAEVSVDEGSEFGLYDFTIDKDIGLSNGDTVTIKISEIAIEEYIENYASAPAESEKTYTVSGLSSYATKMSDISTASLDEMKQAAKDVHESKIAYWNSPDTCKDFQFLGTYFLTAKDMGEEDTKNILYLVYKITVETDTEKFSYYWYIKFENITVLPYGLSSVDLQEYEVPVASSFWGISGEGFEKDNLLYEGYEQLDEMYMNCVTKVIDGYEIENTVTQ